MDIEKLSIDNNASVGYETKIMTVMVSTVSRQARLASHVRHPEVLLVPSSIKCYRRDRISFSPYCCLLSIHKDF